LLAQPLAAAYVGLAEATFRRGVAQGFWPRPLKIKRRRLWDRRMLDGRIDALSNLITAPEPAPEPIRQRTVTLPPQPKRQHVLR
jgi:hypothetical protein